MKDSNRFLALLLALAMMLSMAACGKQQKEESNPYTLSYDRGTTEYEQLYVQQHLDFIAGSDYFSITASEGGLAAAIANVHEDARLNIVNGSWGALDKISTLLDGKEVELVNEYEILVTQLMVGTNSQANFADTFQNSYYNAILTLLAGVTAQLKEAKEAADYFTGDSIEKVEKLTEKLDGILVAIQQLQGAADGEAQPLFEDAMKAVKEAFNESYIKENEELIKKLTGGLSAALNITKLTSESLTDIVDEYVLYKSLTSACEEWETVWEGVSASARSSGDSEGAKIADCIDKILQRTRETREEEIQSIIKSFAAGTGKNLTEFGLAAGGKFLGKLISKHPIGKAILEGVILGVGAANALTNMDNIAYYGRMVIGYGILAKHAWHAMRDAEKALLTSKSYGDALLFDQAFNIYKEIQLEAFRCSIHYCTAIAANPLGYVFKYTIDDEVAESAILNVQQAIWSKYHCHGTVTIHNNGGHVVGYNKDIYYFRMNPEALSGSAMFGAFETNKEVTNALVRRSSDGAETVLLDATANGAIYICNNFLYYRKYDGKLYRTDLADPKEVFFSEGEIIGYLEEQDMLVMRGSNGNIYATDGMDGHTDITAAEYTSIAVKNGCYYHYSDDGKGNYTFYRWEAASGSTQALGTVSIPEVWGTMQSLSSICVASDGIYFLAGYYGGTGFFFQQGNIYFLSFDSGSITTLVEENVTYGTIYVAEEGGSRYLYYYCADDVIGVDLYDGCMSQDVSRIDLNSGAADLVSFPLAEKGKPFIHDGKLMLLDGTNTPVTILGGDALGAIGIGALGFRSDGGAAYHTRVDVVNGIYYVTLMDVSEDDSTSLGWRQGYSRNWARLYRYDPTTGEALVIHDY